jgi:hypothetical protein
MKRLIPTVAALALAGCATAPAADCPGDFAVFLARFSEDVGFQREFTAPTVVTRAPASGADSETVIARRPRSDLTYPLLPPAAERRARGLKERAQLQGHRATFRIDLPDSDAWSVEYGFERRGCWSLVRIDDQSL